MQALTHSFMHSLFTDAYIQHFSTPDMNSQIHASALLLLAPTSYKLDDSCNRAPALVWIAWMQVILTAAYQLRRQCTSHR